MSFVAIFPISATIERVTKILSGVRVDQGFFPRPGDSDVGHSVVEQTE
jgi:hypothetical protein